MHWGIAIILALCISCGAVHAPTPTRPSAFRPVGDPRLHNAHYVTDKVISGAQPENEASFQLLHELGVRTIISVDGAKPDIAAARKYQMRYIHLPIGYDGVSQDDGLAIAKAVEEMPGAIYIHCHHGKHRSAAAVAVACVYNGSLQSNQAEEVLRTFGTGDNYIGLWQSARDARLVDSQALRDLEIEYVDAAEIGPLADAMVRVDHHWDNLKLIQQARWRTPGDHPDLDPAHEALLLQERLHEIGRSEAVMTDSTEEFARMMRQSEDAAGELRSVLNVQPTDIPAAQAAAKVIARSCSACHEAYRD